MPEILFVRTISTFVSDSSFVPNGSGSSVTSLPFKRIAFNVHDGGARRRRSRRGPFSPLSTNLASDRAVALRDSGADQIAGWIVQLDMRVEGVDELAGAVGGRGG